MHSSVGHYSTAEILDKIIDGLNEQHFKVVDLGLMLDINPYKEL
jgi:hypothetical protein